MATDLEPLAPLFGPHHRHVRQLDLGARLVDGHFGLRQWAFRFLDGARCHSSCFVGEYCLRISQHKECTKSNSLWIPKFRPRAGALSKISSSSRYTIFIVSFIPYKFPFTC